MENFRRFLQFFLQFFGKFLQFFRNFLQFFGKFSQNFLQFFSTFATSLRFFGIFSENSRPQSVTVRPGSRHYCKFTSKFTPKFTPILIKILQSTKFEGSHFYSFLSTFQTLLPAFLSLRSFPFAAAFSQPWLRRAKGTNGRPSPCDVGGMWAIRGIISRITSLIVSQLTSQRPGRKPTKNRGETVALLRPLPLPPSTGFFPSRKIPNTYKSTCTNTCKPTHTTPRFPSPPPPLVFSEKISKYL